MPPAGTDRAPRARRWPPSSRVATVRVVLARHRYAASAPGEPPEVHAYLVPDDDISSVPWRAPCGARIRRENAEVVPAFTGAPCSACALLIAASDPAPARACAEEPPEPGSAPTREGFSLSWRERELHRVAADAPRTEFDGRTVVLGLCGRLGWGPTPTPPRGWPRCPECDRIADEGNE